MIHWKHKKQLPTAKLGATKVKIVFLWFPFLNVDGEYYWLGFVRMEYIYQLCWKNSVDGFYKWERHRMIL